MTNVLRVTLTCIALAFMQTLAAQPLAPDIMVTKVINAPVADVWKAWTRTSLTLRNFGYGQGEEWAKTKAYFQQAWPAVMASLEKRFAKP